MPWNPDTYNQFKNIRYQPFFDMTEFISGNSLKNCIDIGCGTGEQTSMLSKKFNQAHFLGIDPSREMLSKSKELESSKLSFKIATVEELIDAGAPQKWDLIFSNAALQWSENHEELFPRLIAQLSDTGQFAVQMPVQKENLLNQILLDLAQESPFAEFLGGWKRESSMLSIDDYAQIMFEGKLKEIQIIQKIYPIIANHPKELVDFIAGSALIPYMEKLSQREQQQFITAYKSRIEKTFKRFPTIYAFKRLLLYGRKNKIDDKGTN
ncbi:methyltransferase domain-containing protein [Parapedobacter pyrenivorans]|uniref:methyltransferase domain-containing protein n=1 Tax=Parapedobacter pyrenivorans TaxID=1305674 RepID=UPI00333F731C